ncbi:hypothetical protein CEXT_325451 [Caerostris extrusa]|uniref:Uncharacterized protein n=1 Tax=Caerostris extrusa TaxID=172846 RepID=A0AAV4MMX8_CAEEX|nr:hypothetical protein CEXT_325451 [Caerostris extrusa]
MVKVGEEGLQTPKPSFKGALSLVTTDNVLDGVYSLSPLPFISHRKGFPTLPRVKGDLQSTVCGSTSQSMKMEGGHTCHRKSAPVGTVGFVFKGGIERMPDVFDFGHLSIWPFVLETEDVLLILHLVDCSH